jgi:hypothetical protein
MFFLTARLNPSMMALFDSTQRWFILTILIKRLITVMLSDGFVVGFHLMGIGQEQKQLTVAFWSALTSHFQTHLKPTPFFGNRHQNHQALFPPFMLQTKSLARGDGR